MLVRLQTRAYNVGTGWRDYPKTIEAESVEAAVRGLAGEDPITPPGRDPAADQDHEWLVGQPGLQVEVRAKPDDE